MDVIEELLRSSNYPSRQVAENLADLSAQVASLRLGMIAMQGLLNEYGRRKFPCVWPRWERNLRSPAVYT